MSTVHEEYHYFDMNVKVIIGYELAFPKLVFSFKNCDE